jgi:hypothetical protein
MMSPTDNISTKKKKKRGKKKKVDHSQYEKGKEISSLSSASRDDSISISKENFDDSVPTMSYQVNSTLRLTSTPGPGPGPGKDEKMNEGEIKEEEFEEYEEEGMIFKSDKQIHYRAVEKVDSNNNNNSNNNRNSVQKKKKGKKRKDKVEWEASVAGDTSSTTKINASCTDSVDDQQNDCQDYSIQTSTQSITSNVISYGSTGSNTRSNPDFSFRVLKEQRSSYMHRLLKKDGSNKGSSYRSSSSDESDLSSVINSNNIETSFNKPISRSELREDLTAQVRVFLEIQDERVAEDVRTSIRRAISKSGGLGIVDEENGDAGGNDDNDDDDDGEDGDGKNTDKNNKDEESGDENNDNKEDGDDGDEIVLRRLKRLTNIIISRRGYIVFVAICVCLLLVGNILLIVLRALKKN